MTSNHEKMPFGRVCLSEKQLGKHYLQDIWCSRIKLDNSMANSDINI